MLTIFKGFCDEEMGMETRDIKNESISATSFENGYEPDNVRLISTPEVESSKAWSPLQQDAAPYLQVNFEDSVQLTGIKTQGDSQERYVQKFLISIFDEKTNEYEYIRKNDEPEIFIGNSDPVSIVENNFEIVQTTSIRVHPIAQDDQLIGLRIEIIGCPLSVTPTPSIIKTTKEETVVTSTSTTESVITTEKNIVETKTTIPITDSSVSTTKVTTTTVTQKATTEDSNNKDNSSTISTEVTRTTLLTTKKPIVTPTSTKTTPTKSSTAQLTTIIPGDICSEPMDLTDVYGTPTSVTPRVSASSNQPENGEGRLDSSKPWTPTTEDIIEDDDSWIQVEFDEAVYIYGLVVKTEDEDSVTKIKVDYKIADNEDWLPVQPSSDVEEFDIDSDDNKPSVVYFPDNKPVLVTVIRVHPTEWSGDEPAIRVGLLGCYKLIQTTLFSSPITKSTTASSESSTSSRPRSTTESGFASTLFDSTTTPFEIITTRKTYPTFTETVVYSTSSSSDEGTSSKTVSETSPSPSTTSTLRTNQPLSTVEDFSVSSILTSTPRDVLVTTSQPTTSDSASDTTAVSEPFTTIVEEVVSTASGSVLVTTLHTSSSSSTVMEGTTSSAPLLETTSVDKKVVTTTPSTDSSSSTTPKLIVETTTVKTVTTSPLTDSSTRSLDQSSTIVETTKSIQTTTSHTSTEKPMSTTTKSALKTCADEIILLTQYQGLFFLL